MSSVAIVLAGGASRRMGVDKLMLPRSAGSTRTLTTMSGESILAHVMKVASAVADDVIVCSSMTRLNLEFGSRVHLLADESAYQGPLLALSRAWEHTTVTTSEMVFVMAGDLPGLTAEVLRACKARLFGDFSSNLEEEGVSKEFRESKETKQVSFSMSPLLCEDGRPFDAALVVREGKLQPLVGCYLPQAKRAWIEALESGDSRLMRAIAHLCVAEVDADSVGWPKWWTRPVHTPEDYEAWLREGVTG